MHFFIVTSVSWIQTGQRSVSPLAPCPTKATTWGRADLRLLTGNLLPGRSACQPYTRQQSYEEQRQGEYAEAQARREAVEGLGWRERRQRLPGAGRS